MSRKHKLANKIIHVCLYPKKRREWERSRVWTQAPWTPRHTLAHGHLSVFADPGHTSLLHQLAGCIIQSPWQQWIQASSNRMLCFLSPVSHSKHPGVQPLDGLPCPFLDLTALEKTAKYCLAPYIKTWISIFTFKLLFFPKEWKAIILIMCLSLRVRKASWG